MILPGVTAGHEDRGSQVRAASFAHFRFSLEKAGFIDFGLQSGESQQLSSPVFFETVDAADFGNDGGGGQDSDARDAGKLQVQFAVMVFDIGFQPFDLVFQQFHLFQQHFDLELENFLTELKYV